MPPSPESRAEILRGLTDICDRAARGDLEARAPEIQDPELAVLGHGLNRLLDQIDAFVRESSAAMEHCGRNRYYRPVLLRGLQGSFRNAAVVINAGVVKMRSDHLARLETTELTTETAAQVATVAAACEELTATSNQIAKRAAESGSRAGNTVTDAERARSSVMRLVEAAERIKSLVTLIARIASQTNLLALNAAIEAARAGAAGSGFAVVASEVKDLSRSTAATTADVNAQVSNVLGGVTAVSQSIDGIGSSIGDIDESAKVVAQAIEEQRIAINEIAESIAGIAERTERIAVRMRGDIDPVDVAASNAA